MAQKAYLNLGCGRIILPAPRPDHHVLVDDAVYQYPLWCNIDVHQSEGVDECMNLFRYPWPLESDSFDGALLTHIVEHIDHMVYVPLQPKTHKGFANLGEWRQRADELEDLPDGFYAFFRELHRVLTAGAMAYILVPYAFSTGAMQDPDHKRYLLPETFGYLEPDPNAPFLKGFGGEWRIRDVRFATTPEYMPMAGDPVLMERLLRTQLNVCPEFYVRLECVK